MIIVFFSQYSSIVSAYHSFDLHDECPEHPGTKKPDRTFHNFRALKSVDCRIVCSSLAYFEDLKLENVWSGTMQQALATYVLRPKRILPGRQQYIYSCSIGNDWLCSYTTNTRDCIFKIIPTNLKREKSNPLHQIMSVQYHQLYDLFYVPKCYFLNISLLRELHYI